MASIDPTILTGAEKASVLLMSLGATASAEALKHLSEQEIELLAPEMVRMQQVDLQVKEAVLTEFQQMRSVLATTISGGKEFAAQVLEQALGQDKANQMIQQLGGSAKRRPFQCLSEADATQIAKLLADEQPQLVAIVLKSIHADKAAAVMDLLDESIQVEVAMRIASTDEIESEVISEIEEVIEATIASSSKGAHAPVGPDALVDILSWAERSTERVVLEALNNRAPEMGAEVRRRMFLFEDLARLPDRAIQLLLREIDQEHLRVALKGADEQIQGLLFKNMSERAAEALKEDLELLQNVKTKDIEAAQQRVGMTARRLLQSGEIALADEDEEPGQES